jgi:hypothetical protein
VKRRDLVALIVLSLMSSSASHATTCLQGRTVKVRQVCGLVTDEYGAAVPDAKIEVVPTTRPSDPKDTSSDQNGRFTFPKVPNGEYDIRISSRYFWQTSQLFRVIHSQEAEKCGKPIHVVMKPAGKCSYVENAWPELNK